MLVFLFVLSALPTNLGSFSLLPNRDLLKLISISLKNSSLSKLIIPFFKLYSLLSISKIFKSFALTMLSFIESLNSLPIILLPKIS